MPDIESSVAEQAQARFDGSASARPGADASVASTSVEAESEPEIVTAHRGPSWWTHRLTLREWIARHGLWTLAFVAGAVGAGSFISARQDSTQEINPVVTAPVPPETRAALYEKLQVSLHDERGKAEASVAEARSALEEMRRAEATVDLESARKELARRLSTLGEQLTAAQVATVQAERTYGKEHPLRQRALDCETQLSNAVNDARAQAQALNERLDQIASAQRELDRREAERARLDARIDAVVRRRDAEVLSAVPVAKPQAANAGAPHRSSSPALPAALIGAAVGLLWSLVRERLDERLRNVDEVRGELGAAVVGVVPTMPARRSRVGRAMISHLDPRGRAADAFRSVRARLLLGGRHTGQPLRTIVVTSAEPGEGRTLCAVNLAVALAQAGRSVLLIDADLRNPSLARVLDLRDGSGLTDVLQSPRSLRWAVQSGGIEGLNVLPSGVREGEDSPPGALIDRFQIQAILAAPTGKYDHIIFDAPAVNDVADATVLASECDATLFVVAADRTTRRSAHAALDALTVVGAKVAGVIVNLAPQGRRFGLDSVRSGTVKKVSASSAPGAAEPRTDNFQEAATSEPAAI